jgi:hypothetical protein
MIKLIGLDGCTHMRDVIMDNYHDWINVDKHVGVFKHLPTGRLYRLDWISEDDEFVLTEVVDRWK